MNLSVEVGAVKPVLELPTIVPPSCLLTPKGSRMSPSRNRRMQRRMETRKLFAEEALNNLSTEKMDVLDAAAEAEKDTIATEQNTRNCILEEELHDEDLTYNVPVCTTAGSDDSEEVDEEELKRDKVVEEVIISAVTEPIEDEERVKNEVYEKLLQLMSK